MTPMIRSSRDVIVRTEQWEAARRFYGTVLGLSLVQEGDSMVGYDTGAFRLYVEQGPAHGAVFDFLVPDVAAAKRALLAAGCTLVEEDPTLPRCYLRDPFGLVFNLGTRAS